MAVFTVTPQEIMTYISKVLQAREEFNSAKSTMKAAADELTSQLKGEYADKFAGEQNTLDMNFSNLDALVAKAVDTVGKIAQTYVEHESNIHA